jgi:hypothetical protein
VEKGDFPQKVFAHTFKVSGISPEIPTFQTIAQMFAKNIRGVPAKIV